MKDALANDAAARRFTWVDGLFLVALAVLTLGVWHWQATSKFLLDHRFLDQDEGISLLVADVLTHGGKLYKDIAYPYGYLPAWLHAFAARLFGNSIATYLRYFLVLDVAAFVLLYFLARRIFRRWAAFLFIGFVVLPEMIMPGAICGGIISNAAYPLEPIFMLAVVLLWRQPGRQAWQRAMLIGLCLGTLQGVKFGTGLVLGASLAAVDLLCWCKTGFDAGTGRRLLRNSLAVLGAFFLMEGIWIAVTLANVPWPIAQDVLWPLYMRKNYTVYTGLNRYPHWLSLNYFVGTQLVPCVGAVASCWWLGARAARRSAAFTPAGPPSIICLSDVGAADGILILLVYYLLAALVFFGNLWHYYIFAWILVLGGVYLMIQPRRAIRWAALALWGGNLLLFARANLHRPSPSLVPVKLDDGEQIWVSPQEGAQITGVVHYLRAAAARDGGGAKPVVFYPMGSGFHPLFHFPHQGRPSWFMVGMLRPYDDPDITSLARSARWVVRNTRLGDPASPDPVVWDENSNVGRPIFDESTQVEIASRLVCEKFIAPDCWIFSQRDPDASSTRPGAQAAQLPPSGNP